MKIILQACLDDPIPWADSQQLVANSGLPPETLMNFGNDHRLANPAPLPTMLPECDRLVQGIR